MTGHQPDQRDRLHYDGFVAALQDVDQVPDDLAQLGTGQLLVPGDRIDFTTRRCRQLVHAAIREARRAGIG